MEQSDNVNEVSVKSQAKGKGSGIAGFVISLISIVLFGFIAWVAAMQAVQAGMMTLMGEARSGGYVLSLSWLGFSVLGLVLSSIGMNKLKKSGAKRGLAVAGLVISIINILLCLALVVGIIIFNKEAKKKADAANAVMKDFDMEKFANEMNATMDSLSLETDTTSAH